MTDVATGTGETPRAGETLRAAREARGLSLDEVAARTRVPLRHLQAIEASDYAELPSPTYAVGFAKAFARAVGADEVAVATRVRGDVQALGRRQPDYTPYEVADPARVPSRWLAIAGLGAAVAVLVLAALWFATSRDGGRGGQPASVAAPAVPVASAPVPAAKPAAATGGQVTLEAIDAVWLAIHDGAGTTLYTGTMKPGERFDVPAGAQAPTVDVGRPDKLRITLNGSAVPPLGTGERPVKDVRVDAASIAARLSGAPAPAPSASAVPTVAPIAAPVAERAAPPRRRTQASRPRLTETQRANLAAAAAGPAPAATPAP